MRLTVCDIVPEWGYLRWGGDGEAVQPEKVIGIIQLYFHISLNNLLLTTDYSSLTTNFQLPNPNSLFPIP